MAETKKTELPYIYNFSLALGLDPDGSYASVLAELKEIAERHPGGPQKKPSLSVSELGWPVGQCFRCGHLAAKKRDGTFRCAHCGPLAADEVAWHVAKDAVPS